jgi:hypothetical protein
MGFNLGDESDDGTLSLTLTPNGLWSCPLMVDSSLLVAKRVRMRLDRRRTRDCPGWVVKGSWLCLQGRSLSLIVVWGVICNLLLVFRGFDDWWLIRSHRN